MIESSGVTIQTVSVTIQALKINNRQMTQAVFNQLPRLGGLIRTTDDDHKYLDEYRFQGNVWGWVNYYPKDSDDEQRQFIVEAGGKLFRSQSPLHRVHLLLNGTHDADTAERVDALFKPLASLALSMVVEAINQKAAEAPWRVQDMTIGDFAPYGEIRVCGTTGNGLSIKSARDILKGSEVHKWFRELHQSSEYGSNQPWYSRADPEFVMEVGKTSPSEWRRVIQADIDWIVAHVAKINAMRAVLAAAEQLFIAV